MNAPATVEIPCAIRPLWERLDSGFPLVAEVFPECMEEASRRLSPAGIENWIDSARFLGKMGLGPEPILIFLEKWPAIAANLGEGALPAVMDFVKAMWKSPNGKAIVPFLQSLPAVARRLHSQAQIKDYLSLCRDLMARTTGSIHGTHDTFPSPGLPEFFGQAHFLLQELPIQGLQKWVDYGIRNYGNHPERQAEYFALRSADSRAVMQRERRGTLLVDHERLLDLYLRGLWEDDDHFIPYSTAFDEIRKPVPYYDGLGIRLPDVQHDADGISGIDRYRAMLAHIAAHRRWTSPIIADNYSPFQRMAIEFFEDARMEFLAMREYPGLGRIFLALHPTPAEDACDPEIESCLRHRLALISRAIIDPGHLYRDPDIIEFATRFHALLKDGASTTRETADLALSFVARTRRQSDQLAKIHFKDTVIPYRDDNRHMWRYIEEGDEEELFEEKRKAEVTEEIKGLPPRHYPEWEYTSNSYRPDWVSVYECLHPAGDAAAIDRILARHAGLAKQLERLLDLLKPQEKVRIRYQEEGTDLDLDIALRSFIDLKSGTMPDMRINMSHRTDGRDIAVLLLIDLSESLNEPAAGGEQTVLELSREAVSLLAWAIDRLGDRFAIAGFNSNTRHEVRYFHIKGYGERLDEAVKGRLAAMEAAYSTRMGAAIRHAGHYLKAQKADKRLLLVLTDGEPSDIDVNDKRLLIDDTRKAVQEIDRHGIYTHCITLDPQAGAYAGEIFGPGRFSVVDRIERLPERLPQLFMALTK